MEEKELEGIVSARVFDIKAMPIGTFIEIKGIYPNSYVNKGHIFRGIITGINEIKIETQGVSYKLDDGKMTRFSTDTISIFYKYVLEGRVELRIIDKPVL
ncbi:MAG TPA: hypothetical protein VK190_03415 [Pseudoneobacillus sp.]|nr:hypothetical protein [Pseudoneobacillus sp.]